MSAAAQRVIRRDPVPQPQNVSITALPTTITQNFNALPASGSATWTNNSTLPGWYHARTGTGTTIVADAGTNTGGNLYSYGTGTTTDRALGSIGSSNAAAGNFFWGILLTNNTGATITSLDVSYVGEQWRNSAAAAQTISFSYLTGTGLTGSLANFQAAGTLVSQLDFTSPVTGGTAGALDGNLAANRTAKSHAITGLSLANGQQILLRWSDPDHAGTDHGLAIDDFAVTLNGGSTALPALAINDVSQDEGNSGTTAYTFTVTMAPASSQTVTVNYATANGTTNPATGGASCDTAGVDYITTSGTLTFVADDTSEQLTVQVCGDSTSEPNETFFVNLSGATNATISDAQGLGTIVNDDFTITPIHNIQGSGAASPLAGQTVTTTGIVTLLKTGSNAGAGAASGYFLQTTDGEADADPNTSQGIFVFTSTAPTVSVGDEVRVTGTAVEFNGLTEITSVTNTSVIDTGNPLPTAVTLDTTILDPTATGQPQLEKYEGMRLSATSLRTVAPNDNFFDVYTVLGQVPRPMREPGIPATDPVPPDPTTGTPDCCIPRWDENPERLKLDTNGRAGAPNAPYTSNVTFTGVSGPLDFGFGEYRLVAEASLSASPNMTATALPLPDSNEFTVASYNIENFQNNATQREKAALTIRNILHYPDVIGLVEIDDLAHLQALATEVNGDAVADGDPDPQYEAYLSEGNSSTGGDVDQNVGFLVKTTRVQVNSVTQERKAETYQEPGGTTAFLHDRPPLVLDATVDPSGASSQRVIVVVNHLRSFINIEQVAGEGPRVREKRKKQAESLADLLNDLQTANANVPVISVGDYNAFQFNSGYDDSISVIKGNPTPDEQIVVDQSPDLVNPDFFNLIDELPASERYSFIFEGTPQALDHHLVNTAARARNTRTAIARVNSDFPENPPTAYVNNAATPERNSDHDPVVSYYGLGQVQAAGAVIISEFRFRGPGLAPPPPPEGPSSGGDGDSIGAPGPALDHDGPGAPGTAEDNDEYIEFYNDTDSDITVSTLDGSAGWALVASDGAVRFIIPNGTVIPARGHFLAVNVDGYSLCPDPDNGSCYAQGDTVLLPDGATSAGGYTLEIADGSGIALFNTSNPTGFTTSNRLDAVGYSTAPELYREGAGLPTGGAEIGNNLEYAWLRQQCAFVQGVGCTTPGTPKDTEANQTDFISVDTTGVTQSLGAPGPEGLLSPLQRNSSFNVALLDQGVAASQPPNRDRDMTQDPGNNASFGKLTIRRKVTNNTGGPVSYLAFRIVQITTHPAGSAFADLRALDSDDATVTLSNGQQVPVSGTYIERPPQQPMGGGLNTSMGVNVINLEGNAIEPGDFVNVQFVLGIQKTGTFRFYINVEAFGDNFFSPETLRPLRPSGPRVRGRR